MENGDLLLGKKFAASRPPHFIPNKGQKIELRFLTTRRYSVLGSKVVPRLRECCRQSHAEVVSKSKNTF